MLPRILKSNKAWRRCFSDMAPGCSKDAIYLAFLDKVREYRLKSPTGRPVDPTPEYEEELKVALEKLAVRYGGGEGVDLLKFPKFKMPDIDIDPISIYDLPENQHMKKKGDEEVEESECGVKDKKGKKEEKGKKAEKSKTAKDDKKTKP